MDTGLPAGTPEEKPDEKSPAYTGKDICSYMEAFAALGYRPEQVTKKNMYLSILVGTAAYMLLLRIL